MKKNEGKSGREKEMRLFRTCSYEHVTRPPSVTGRGRKIVLLFFFFFRNENACYGFEAAVSAGQKD